MCKSRIRKDDHHDSDDSSEIVIANEMDIVNYDDVDVDGTLSLLHFAARKRSNSMSQLLDVTHMIDEEERWEKSLKIIAEQFSYNDEDIIEACKDIAKYIMKDSVAKIGIIKKKGHMRLAELMRSRKGKYVKYALFNISKLPSIPLNTK